MLFYSSQFFLLFCLGVFLSDHLFVNLLLVVSASSSSSSSKLICEPVPPVRHREDLALVLQNENFKVGAEIGVRRGEFSKSLLDQWTNAKKFYCIDPWLHQKNYVDLANHPQRTFDYIFRQARILLRPFSEKVRFIRKYSTDAVHFFEDNSLDFVYIDARHDYNGAFTDLKIFWPKVRRGGIIAGHDFLDQPDVDILLNNTSTATTESSVTNRWDINEDGSISPNGKAVRSAVLEFAASVKHQVVTTSQDAWPTWYIRKCI